jgi:nicotinate-nucleotide pyrophosphorylase (carboxylating)
MKLEPAVIKEIVTKALEEDIGSGDITTAATVPVAEEVRADIVPKEDCVVAGLPVARGVFRHLDANLSFEECVKEGENVAAGKKIAALGGFARTILMGERTALNFLQHLCGIATVTRRYVELVKDTGATILDTRKTLPGLRHLEKYAVAIGGGVNHRMGLYDRVLIKDNHLMIQERYGTGGIGRAVALAREKNPGVPIEVETASLADVEESLEAGAEYILLDNMSVEELGEAVKLVGERAITEASGGVSLDNVREIALTGVQYISIGYLTHSAKAVDISLQFKR